MNESNELSSEELYQLALELQAQAQFEAASQKWSALIRQVHAGGRPSLSVEVLVDVYLQLANCLGALGEYSQAHKYLQSAIHSVSRLPDEEPHRRQKIFIHGEYASNLEILGLHEQAEEAYQSILGMYDGLLENDEAELERANLEVSRANNMVSLDKREDADLIYFAALNRFLALPQSDLVLLQFAMALEKRAENLKAINRPEDALSMLASAVTLYDELPAMEEVILNQATVRKNLATELNELAFYAEAEGMYRQSSDLFDQLSDDQVRLDHQANIRFWRAENLEVQGNREMADDLYQQSILFFDEMPKSDSTCFLHGSAYGARAINLSKLGHFDVAETAYGEALRLFDQVSTPELLLEERATICANRGTNLGSLGQFSDAAKWLAQAIDYYDSNSDSESTPTFRARVRLSAASNFSNMGRYEDADRLFADAITLYEQAEGDDEIRLEQIAVMNNRATNLSRLNHTDAAEHVLKQALKSLKRLADNEQTQWSLMATRLNRATNLRGMGRFDDAAVMFEEALSAIGSLADSPKHRLDLATLLMACADNRVSQGRYDEAESLLLESLQRFSDVAESDAILLDKARLHLRLAHTCLLNKRTTDAWQALTPGLALLDPLLANDDASVPALLNEYAAVLIAIDQADDLNSFDCVERLTTISAQAMNWLDLVPREALIVPSGLETESGQGGGDQPDQLTGGLRVRELIGRTLSYLVRTAHTDQICALLVDYSSRYSAAQQNGPVLPADETNQTANNFIEIDQQIRQIRAYGYEMNGLQAAAPTSGSEALAARLAEIRQRRDSLKDKVLAAMRSHRGSLNDTLPGGTAITASALRKMLQDFGDPDATLVVILRVGHADSTRSVALVLSAGNTNFVPVDLPNSVTQVASQAELTNQELPFSGNALRAAVLESWEALNPLLDAQRNVYIAVHQGMGCLPWESVFDDLVDPPGIRVFQGINHVVSALALPSATTVTSPNASRPIGVLAHSPPQAPTVKGKPAARGSNSWRSQVVRIPGVYVDRAATQAICPNHLLMSDRADLLEVAVPLLQMSCHGNPIAAHTGANDTQTSAYALAQSLRERKDTLQALLMIACSTGQSTENAWGETAGWSVVLHRDVPFMVAPLYPVDDWFCSLFVILLHTEWQRLNDLRAALRSVRRRMRSGDWSDSEQQSERILMIWQNAIATAYGQEDSTSDSNSCEELIQDAQDYFAVRHKLYDVDSSWANQAYQRVTDGFVMIG